jgi:hypothetical protein
MPFMKKTIYLLSLLFLLITSLSYAQEVDAEIVDFRIKSKLFIDGKLETTKYVLVKINNREGRKYAKKTLYYKKGEKMKIITALILDKNLDKVRKIKKNEIKETEGSYYTFHTDQMKKKVKAYYDVYPYYMQLVTKHISSNFVSFPAWFPQDFENINSSYSSYELIVPKSQKIHYKFHHFTPKERISEIKEEIHYFWETDEHLALNKYMAYSSPLVNDIPYGRIIPDTFTFGLTQGSTASWKEYGDWYSRLTKNLDNLSEPESVKVKALVKDIKDEKEKIRLLYHYLQESTRYVGVSEGLGGLIPFDADYVCKNEYGDCKALTNYMKAMLKTVGIDSYFALIKGGDDDRIIDTSFVFHSFDHVVLFIPLEKDTLWLENTTQELPFGYWGTFTNSKFALICNYQDSKLIRTPSFTHQENSTKMTASVEVKGDLLSVKMKSVFLGENFEDITYRIRDKNEKEILEDSQDSYVFSQFIVNEIKYTSKEETPFSITRELNISVGKHIQKFKDKLMLRPIFSPFSLEDICPKKKGLKIFIPFNEEVTDSVYYSIPSGYELVQLPDSSSLNSVFGHFKIDYQREGNEILVIRVILQNEGLYPVDDYDMLKAFLKKIKTLENNSLLFKQIL